ncbi:MAG: VOC family protein [Pseudomonadota bacterium]
MSRGFQVRGLGEVAIRCTDLAAMVAFYRDVIGLPILEGNTSEDIIFFRIGPGYGGHTTVLALFRQGASSNAPQTGAASSLHHLALTVGAEEQAAVIAWYRAQGWAFTVEDFSWIGWRGVFTQDPEGNTVELVAKVADPASASVAQETNASGGDI